MDTGFSFKKMGRLGFDRSLTNHVTPNGQRLATCRCGRIPQTAMAGQHALNAVHPKQVTKLHCQNLRNRHTSRQEEGNLDFRYFNLFHTTSDPLDICTHYLAIQKATDSGHPFKKLFYPTCKCQFIDLVLCWSSNLDEKKRKRNIGTMDRFITCVYMFCITVPYSVESSKHLSDELKFNPISYVLG